MPTLEGHFARLILLAVICASSCTVKAQVTTGTFLGTVYDSTKAAVPGASITVTNLQTGVSRSVLSTATGEYVINLLPVGSYSLRVEHAGFKTEERSSIEIQINSRVRLDFVLQVGAVSEEVKVAGSAPLLDTDTAETGEVIENQRVTQLPLNGRQFIQLALLTAGVVPEVKGTLSSPLALSGQSANANGTRYEDNVFLLDGVSVRDEIYTRLTVSPSIDSIQEFKVHTSNYSAEFGGHGGAQINVSTKSGTNSFHGAVYEFLRNDVLDAKNFFDGSIKPPFRQNQFGASVGGPIKRNKTFFFGNYEGSRIFKGVTLGAALPTEDMRSGNFTGMGPIINPATQLPFTNDQIPDSMIAPFAKAMLANVPLPTTTGLGRNFTGFGDRDVSMDQFTARIDHTFNNSNLIFGRFIYSNVDDLEPYPATVDLSSGSPLPPPGFGQRTSQRSRNVALQYTHVFSPTLLNQVRFGYNYLDAGQKSANSNVDFVSQFGFQGTNPPPEPTAPWCGIPQHGHTGIQHPRRCDHQAVHSQQRLFSYGRRGAQSRQTLVEIWGRLHQIASAYRVRLQHRWSIQVSWCSWCIYGESVRRFPARLSLGGNGTHGQSDLAWHRLSSRSISPGRLASDRPTHT
jgi:hypothetical protein